LLIVISTFLYVYDIGRYGSSAMDYASLSLTD